MSISIHAPRTGSDDSQIKPGIRPGISIHAPRTGSDQPEPPEQPAASNFNPRSPHGERRRVQKQTHPPKEISIHAPRTGSDHGRGLALGEVHISIHAPRTGSDEDGAEAGYQLVLHFNPRSPHGERPDSDVVESIAQAFQSTLPARGATALYRAVRARKGFQSTLPARGATHLVETAPDLYRNFNPRSPHGERQNAPMSQR